MSKAGYSTGDISVNGAHLRYAVEGSGTAVLVIGSAFYYPRTFSRQLRQFCRMAFVDVRHFAESDATRSPDNITLDTYLADIESLRSHLKIDRAVVVGHSHHGNLALEYAKRFPERVSRLVLIGSPPREVSAVQQAAAAYWEHHSGERRKSIHQRNLNALFAEGFDRLSPEHAFVAQYVAEGAKYWYDPDYDAAHLWRDVPVNMAALKAFRDFFGTGYEMCWNPEVMKAPVLVVMGRYDYAVPCTLWDEIQSKLANLTFHLFEASAHTPQLEEPERFDRILLEWLKSPA